MKLYEIRHFESEDDKRRYVAHWDNDLDARLASLAERLTAQGELHAIGLTGPTCSGKTTAANKLTSCLEAHGMRVHVISIDDFYYDKEYLLRRAELDPEIEIDYDSEDTIDVSLFEEKVGDLLALRPTRLPHFDFQSGIRTEGKRIEPDERDVFLFEGIQVLYPRIDAILRKSSSYRCIYIEPSSALRAGGVTFLPNEIRRMRRVVRDYLKRSTDPAFTLYLWQSVRENEDRHIFPYADRCDELIDSTLPYEIGMLKPYLETILAGIPQEDPFFDEAMKMLRRLADIEPVPADYMLQNSLYKEFIS